MIVDYDGSLQISSQIENTVQPSWSDHCSEEREKILYLILIKDRGKAGERRRRGIRELWAGSLPPSQRHVFVILAGDSEADIERESDLHDDILQLDLLPTDLYSEHKSLLLSLHFSFSLCRGPHHTLLLDQTVTLNPTVVERLSDREISSANRLYGLMYRNFSPSRDRYGD